MTRVQNSSRYTEILLYSPRFRSNCRHFSRPDFHACRASISKVNRWRTPRSFPIPIFFYSRAGGIEDICMYSAWLHTGGLPIFPQYRDTANCCPASLFSSCKCVHAGSSCTHLSLWFYGISSGWSDDMQSWQLCAIWYFALFSFIFSFLCGRLQLFMWALYCNINVVTFIIDIDAYVMMDIKISNVYLQYSKYN